MITMTVLISTTRIRATADRRFQALDLDPAFGRPGRWQSPRRARPGSGYGPLALPGVAPDDQPISMGTLSSQVTQAGVMA